LAEWAGAQAASRHHRQAARADAWAAALAGSEGAHLDRLEQIKYNLMLFGRRLPGPAWPHQHGQDADRRYAARPHQRRRDADRRCSAWHPHADRTQTSEKLLRPRRARYQPWTSKA
jgi:hypothetical protein